MKFNVPQQTRIMFELTGLMCNAGESLPGSDLFTIMCLTLYYHHFTVVQPLKTGQDNTYVI